jgi:hypothetical protein
MVNLHTCPDCKCQFVQPFKCVTCGAEKLYDATVRSQAAQIELQKKALVWLILNFESFRDPPKHLDAIIQEAAGSAFDATVDGEANGC